MRIHTRRLHGHGGNFAQFQPFDELAKPRRVGGKFANVGRAIGVVADADPVARIANVDAGRVLVVDRHRRHFGLRLKRFVLLARVELRLTLGGAFADFLARFALMGLLLLRVAFGHVGPLCEELKCEQTYRGGVGTNTAVPTGSGTHRDVVDGCRSPNEWAENAPQLSRTNGLSHKDSITIYQTSIARYAMYRICKFLSLWGGGPPRRGGAPGAAADGGGTQVPRESLVSQPPPRLSWVVSRAEARGFPRSRKT